MSLVSELRRRRVFRVAAWYAAAAWLLIQVASTVFPQFDLPAWTVRAVIVASVAGFPLALALAWLFQIAPEGVPGETPAEWTSPAAIRWTNPSLLLALAAAAALGGGAAWFVGRTAPDVGTAEQGTQPTSAPLPVVSVLSMENLTGDTQNDWLGQGLANLIRDELGRSRFLMVATTGSATGARPGTSPNGVSHVVSGEVLRTPGGLVWTVRLTDVEAGRDLIADRFTASNATELVAVSTSVAMLAKQGLNVPRTERVDVFAADFAAKHIVAYESYVVGLEFFLRYKYEDARRSFELALRQEPSYAMARYRLAQTLAVLGDTEGALVEIRKAAQQAAALPDQERRYIRAAEPYFARRYGEAEKQYRSLLETYPYDREARQLLVYILYDQERYEDALSEAQVLAVQAPDSEVVWGAIAELNLQLGRFDAADAASKRFVEIAPDNPNAYLLMGDSLFRRGRFDEARPRYQEAIERDPNFPSAPLQLAYIDALRGDWPSAIVRFQAIAEREQFPASSRVAAAFEWAYLLRASGRCRESNAVLDRFNRLIAQEGIRQALGLAVRSYCALDAGRAAEAVAYARQSVSKAPGVATRYLFAQALSEIAAKDFAAADRSIAAISAPAKAGDEQHQTERKAVSYLSGLSMLARDDARGALPLFSDALRGPGYEYDIYRLGHALALQAVGESVAAEQAARRASEGGGPEDPRLDLEASRQRAQLLLIRLLQQSGRSREAEVLADALAAKWSNADVDFRPLSELHAIRGRQ